MLDVKTSVGLADQTVQVSTVSLYSGRGFETALFFEDGGWETVEWYPTVDKAIAGHGAWSRGAVIGYVLSALKAQRQLDYIIEGEEV
jgi:hypothetical protein